MNYKFQTETVFSYKSNESSTFFSLPLTPALFKVIISKPKAFHVLLPFLYPSSQFNNTEKSKSQRRERKPSKKNNIAVAFFFKKIPFEKCLPHRNLTWISGKRLARISGTRFVGSVPTIRNRLLRERNYKRPERI